MKNLHPVYTCEDYDIDDEGVLLIENPVLLGMVEDESQFNKLIGNALYNCVICPALYANKDWVGSFEYVKFIY